MITPKKKISISAKHSRNSTWQFHARKKLLNMASFGKCDNCGNMKLSHRVCKVCGFYNGKQVLTIKSKEKILEA